MEKKIKKEINKERLLELEIKKLELQLKLKEIEKAERLTVDGVRRPTIFMIDLQDKRPKSLFNFKKNE